MQNSLVVQSFLPTNFLSPSFTYFIYIYIYIYIVFLSQLQKEIFILSEKPLRYSNLSKEEWQAVRSLANDCNIVIKKADKG